MRSTRFPAGWYCYAPTYDANGNLTSGDINCATVMTQYQNYMWSGMVGLFVKMEQNNLFNEINFNLAPTMARQRDRDPPHDRRACLPVQPPAGDRRDGHRQLDCLPAWAVRLPRKHGRRHGAPQQLFELPDPRSHQSVLPRLRQRPYVPELGSEHGGHHRRHVHDGDLSARASAPTGVWSQATSCCVRTNIDRTINKPILYNGRNYYTYWMSKHPNQVNFAFCDGHVRPVTQQINKLVLNKIMTRNGGETVSTDEIK